MVHGRLTENEMRVVHEARAQSRREAAELERLSQGLKARSLLKENAGVKEFHAGPSENESAVPQERARRAGS